MRHDTNDGNNLFSYGRFASYFKLYLNLNKRKMLLNIGQLFIVTFILFIFLYYNGGRFQYATAQAYCRDTSADPFWEYSISMMMIIVFICLAVAGAAMYNNVSTKKLRLTTLQLPASQTEKFLTWWVVYLPCFLIALLACFYAADIMRVVWVKLFSDYGEYAHVIPVGNLLTLSGPDWFDRDPAMAVCGPLLIYSLLILTNSVFAVGGIFFNKNPLPKTIGTLFIMLIVGSLLFSLGTRVFYAGHLGEIMGRFDGAMEDMAWIFASISGVLSICFYWLSYARFKETDIVNRW